MDLLDIEVVQLAVDERLRKAEQRRRFLVLSAATAGQAPIAGANGLFEEIKRWLRVRTAHQSIHDTRRPHAV